MLLVQDPLPVEGKVRCTCLMLDGECAEELRYSKVANKNGRKFNASMTLLSTIAIHTQPPKDSYILLNR